MVFRQTATLREALSAGALAAREQGGHLADRAMLWLLDRPDNLAVRLLGRFVRPWELLQIATRIRLDPALRKPETDTPETLLAALEGLRPALGDLADAAPLHSDLLLLLLLREERFVASRILAMYAIPAVEIATLIRTLCRRRKNNPLLIGPAGVGKSALVEGLAQRLVQGNVPPPLRGRRLLALDLAALIAGTTYRGDLEQRVHALLRRLEHHREAILFIDELHLIVGAGAGRQEGPDVADLLKPALARGLFPCIGATTPEAYRRTLAGDRALLTRLTEAVAGQEQAVEQLANTLRRLHTGLSDPDRPAGVLLLAGPAGTGKRRMADLPGIPADLAERTDGVIRFVPASLPAMRRIVRNRFTPLAARAAARGIRLALSDRACDHLARRVLHRPETLRRLLVDTVEEPLAALLVGGRLAAGEQVRIATRGSRIILQRIRSGRTKHTRRNRPERH